jgi:hypothetical protein
MDSSEGVPIIPKVLFKSVERFERSRFRFGGVDPQVLFISSCPGYTGLTGASHLWDLPRVNCLTRVSLDLGAAGLFLVCLVLFC